MAAQAAFVAETIAGMKRAIRGYQDSSDSENSNYIHTNRGNKLKRKARYAHDGRLDQRTARTRIAKHAGYERRIISRIPKRYDEYGDELDADDVDEEADSAVAETNPYEGVKLEQLLAPLSSAADLPNHPSLSIVYKSNILDDMVQQACDMVHKEKRTLWNVKQLLTKFRGDASWIPCEVVDSDQDISLFGNNNIHSVSKGLSQQTSQIHDDPFGNVTGIGHSTERNECQVQGLDASREASHSPDLIIHRLSKSPTRDTVVDGRAPHDSGTNKNTVEGLQCKTSEPNTIKSNIESQHRESQMQSVRDRKDQNRRTAERDSPAKSEEQDNTKNDPGQVQNDDEAVADEEGQQPAHRMTTRAQAQAVSDKTANSRTRSPSPTASVPVLLHPLYLIPSSAVPNRDFGLPEHEAEETRRLLMAWVQKQEEVCRGVDLIYEGLLKAQRMRSTVLGWCKAEGHVGEMSDAEEWYDKEEWGLDEDLKKGHEEEDEDAGNQGKKTRGRRA